MKNKRLLTAALVFLTVYFCTLYLKSYDKFGLKLGVPELDIVMTLVAGFSASLVTISVILSGQTKRAGVIFALLDFLISVVLLLDNNANESTYIILGAVLFSLLTSMGLFFIAEIFLKSKQNENIKSLEESYNSLMFEYEQEKESREQVEKEFNELKLNFSRSEEELKNIIATSEELKNNLVKSSEEEEELYKEKKELESKLNASLTESKELESILLEFTQFGNETRLKQSLSQKLKVGKEEELIRIKPALLSALRFAENCGYNMNETGEKINAL